MSRSFVAGSSISHPSSKYIWVSDALLTDSLTRFCHRRHGSNVPGPLEAQRRAARRKNTCLASVGSGGISVDPAIVLASSTTKVDWWSRLQDGSPRTRHVAPSRLLPSWLFPSQEPPSTIDSISVAEQPELPHVRIRKTAAYEMAALRQCRNLPEIEQWVQREGINLREDFIKGAAILDHILSGEPINLPVSDVAAYICNPSFHPTGSSFILDLVRTILPRVWDKHSWSTVWRSIQAATELGLVSVEDMRSIIVEVLNTEMLLVHSSTSPSLQIVGREKVYVVCGIIESLDRSAVLQITDLGCDLLSVVFTEVAKHYRLNRCREMIWRLLPWAQRDQFRYLARVTLKLLRRQPKEGSADLESQELVDRLVCAKPEVLQLILMHTTEELLECWTEVSVPIYKLALHRWCYVLAVLGGSNRHGSTTQHAWEFLKLQESTLSVPQRAFACAWTAQSLCYQSKSSPNLSDRLHGMDCFDQMVAFLPKFTVDVSEFTVLETSNLPLPHKDTLLQNLTRLNFFGEVLPEVEADTDVRAGIAKSKFARGTHNAHHGHSEGLAGIIEASKYGFPAFKAFSRRIIHKNTESFGIVCHFLETDKRLSKVLHVSRVAILAGSRSVWVTEGLKNVDAIDQGEKSITPATRWAMQDTYTREQVQDLVHHLAISFATSPVATARSALRRVYWCYRFFGHHGFPVDSTITRALWHVGVTRYCAEGTSAALMSWLLSCVRKVEGDDVAMQLLMSSRFRRSRDEEMVSWSWITPEEEQTLQAMIGERDLSPADNDADCSPCKTSPVAGLFQCSAQEVEALYTGDEETDRKLQAKIKFIMSELPFEPFVVSWNVDELAMVKQETDSGMPPVSHGPMTAS